MTPEPDLVSFKVERLALAKSGRLEVSGRWYGVRGRRFMRPTLIYRQATKEGEQRVLADLEHKPWAAENGSRWTAAFALEIALEDAAEIELAVAPDITVPLGAGGAVKGGTRQAAKAGAAAAQARSPRVRSDPIRARPRERSPEAERLRERLDASEQAIARERAKREGVEETLEQERRAARQLRAELGRVQAELELAGAVQRELDTASAALDTLRSQSRDTGRRLETAERELGEERSTAESLRRQLADADAAVKRLTGSGPVSTSRTDSEVTAGPSRTARPPFQRAGRVAGTELGQSLPGQPHPSEPGRERPRERSRPSGERSRPAGERGRAERLPAERHHPSLPRSERPLNPSLRSGSWLIRGLAVVGMLIVILAIVLVIRSTVG
ncbi:MAG: hypothetical protein WCB67_11575 [Solirubrobacteraceae bacterium]